MGKAGPWEEREPESWRKGGNIAWPCILQICRVGGVWSSLRAPSQRGRHGSQTLALFRVGRESAGLGG